MSPRNFFKNSYPLVISTLTVRECIPVSDNSEICKILDHGGEKCDKLCIHLHNTFKLI